MTDETPIQDAFESTRGSDLAHASDRATDGPGLPRTVTDDENRAIRLKVYEDDAFDRLHTMYATFDPSQRAQGLPPREEELVCDWLASILDGVSVLACHDDSVVGHVAFVPGGDACELAIFVRRAYQRAGIGSVLLQAGLARARANGVDAVWLAVARWNHAARTLYRRAGFETDDVTGSEIRMSRRL